jgi:hypothetical protein
MQKCFRTSANSKELAYSAATVANTLAGALTAQLREIERWAGWRNHRDLRHWHQQFTAARELLLTRTPERVGRNLYAVPNAVAAEPSGMANWGDLFGDQ